MRNRRWMFVAALAVIPALAGAAQQPSTDIGDINFPNSGAPEAQASFLRGVAALHNFWFDEAADEFKNAQETDPSFAMAYWGEAMSYNHPLWAQQDIAAARQVMRRFGKTRKDRIEKVPTEREKMYWAALETLYGEGDKLVRDIAYEKAMGNIQEAHPDDVEAATFHALSILGTVRRGDTGFFRQVRAGTIALDLFARYPNHPGAAHFVIHSFDDPEHAPLALAAAEKYALIAPAASHALHMPTHIFVQHGMWDRVAQSNERAFAASDAWAQKKHLSASKKDWHSLEWGAYANAQRGVWSEIGGAIELVRREGDEGRTAPLVQGAHDGALPARSRKGRWARAARNRRRRVRTVVARKRRRRHAPRTRSRLRQSQKRRADRRSREADGHARRGRERERRRLSARLPVDHAARAPGFRRHGARRDRRGVETSRKSRRARSEARSAVRPRRPHQAVIRALRGVPRQSRQV